MANFEIKEPKQFSEEVRKFEVTDPNHADVFNRVVDILINNDAYLKQYVEDKIKSLIGDAPEALDTLKELADALGNDKDFGTTIIGLINNKYTDLAGAGRTKETVKGVSEDLDTLRENLNKFKGAFTEITVVDTLPSESEMKERVLYLVKEGGN